MLAHLIFSLRLNQHSKNEKRNFLRFKGHSHLYIGSLSHHLNGSVTNYTRYPSPTHAITVQPGFISNLSPTSPLFPFITDATQLHDLEMKATGWSIHPSEHLKPRNQISLKTE
ncbi:hypothetical protein AVEN_3436-1 [Araneus ventricosus]|uniref:Uncharacterized protein n=1 Tax=Araneus ventricosus TaxID=182803 RepID=A0A4Y2NJA0_ARAVE|nr:hypothetical protein AVEN_3436-1 [Araneus ventricosus]